jgi:hypothetical protein
MPHSTTTMSHKKKKKNNINKKQKRSQVRYMTLSEENLLVKVVDEYKNQDNKISWKHINEKHFDGKFSSNTLFQKYNRKLNIDLKELTREEEIVLYNCTESDNYRDKCGRIRWTWIKDDFGFIGKSTTQLSNRVTSLRNNKEFIQEYEDLIDEEVMDMVDMVKKKNKIENTLEHKKLTMSDLSQTEIIALDQLMVLCQSDGPE